MGIRDKARLKMDEFVEKAKSRSENKIPDQREGAKPSRHSSNGMSQPTHSAIHRATSALRGRRFPKS